MLLPSVADGTCMMSTGSSLKYSFFWALEYVSSGHASSLRAATLPVGADIRSNTETNEMTDARSLASASETRGSVATRKRIVLPASAIFSFPPVNSPRSSVLTT